MRAAAMKMCAKSWHTPRLAAQAAAAVVCAWVLPVSKIIRWLTIRLSA